MVFANLKHLMNYMAPPMPRGLGLLILVSLTSFVDKRWGDIKLAFEAALVSGDIGDVGKTGQTSTTISAQTYIVDLNYKLNPKWNVGLLSGFVSGDDASSDSFEGMFLHPNFNIAQILYRYDYNAFNNESNTNIFDASISNSTFLSSMQIIKQQPMDGTLPLLQRQLIRWRKTVVSFMIMKAIHFMTANGDQAGNLGLEFDAEFNYFWNPSITVSGFLAYLQTGDYFAFTNTGTDFELQDVYTYGFRLSVDF
jgi:hypothetical protein